MPPDMHPPTTGDPGPDDEGPVAEGGDGSATRAGRRPQTLTTNPAAPNSMPTMPARLSSTSNTPLPMCS